MSAVPTSTAWCAYRDGVVVPGVATVRIPDMQGAKKIRCGPRSTRYDRSLYVAAGMTAWQWKRVSAADRAKVRWAYLLMMAPSNVGREPDPVDWEAFDIGNRSL